MATLTKKELKGILKECLREILKEEGVVLAEAGRSSNNRVAAKESVTTTHSAVTTPAQPVQNTRLMETVNQLSDRFDHGEGSAQANMMRNIFADTAATTLQEQQGAGHSVGAGGSGGGMPIDGGDIAMPASPQRVAQDSNELQALSHEGDVGRWAQVAFAGKGSN